MLKIPYGLSSFLKSQMSSGFEVEYIAIFSYLVTILWRLSVCLMPRYLDSETPHLAGDVVVVLLLSIESISSLKYSSKFRGTLARAGNTHWRTEICWTKKLTVSAILYCCCVFMTGVLASACCWTMLLWTTFANWKTVSTNKSHTFWHPLMVWMTFMHC